MKREKMRIIKITDEIINFLYSIGAEEIDIKLKSDQEKHILVFSADYIEITQVKMDQLIHVCEHSEKKGEVEEFYWELLGDAEKNSELSLVELMIDDVSIDITDDTIRIQLERFRN